VLISVNPMAGPRAADSPVGRLAHLLKERGLSPRTLSDLPQVAALANQWHAEGHLRALVGVGGDGTAAELVNRTTPGLPITLLPAGNENLLARHLGLDNSPAALCDTIAEGNLLRLDAGKANGRVFLLMIGCGFDADVVRRTHMRRTGHIGKHNYAKPIVDTIRSYQYPELRVTWEDSAAVDKPATHSVTAKWVFGFNLPCYGGGIRLAPKADAVDGLLDVCTFEHGSLWHGLRYLCAVFRGRHEDLPDCRVWRSTNLRIECDAEVPYQLDGDPGGILPVEVGLLPERLTVVVPATTLERFSRVAK